ncbi:hypothetical protein EJ110_NYTH33697 [Nymphaea thermarum]|nr:hypothetical protein EJ110_NYTH33697 [Nymphaea thermarum]
MATPNLGRRKPNAPSTSHNNTLRLCTTCAPSRQDQWRSRDISQIHCHNPMVGCIGSRPGLESTAREPDAFSPSPSSKSPFPSSLAGSHDREKQEVDKGAATMLGPAEEERWRRRRRCIGDTTTPLKEKVTAVSFKQFMSMQRPVFTGDDSPDKTEEWIGGVERIFELLKMPEGDKVNYGSYLLKGDVKRWWQSTLHARNKKMQEFLELQQNQLSLEEYVTKYRHLEAYCLHIYTTDEAKADKFIHGLHDGLRSKVMSSRPRDLDEVVTMTRRMEEDWARTENYHNKKTSQHTYGGRIPAKHQHFADNAKPYERRDD